MREGRRSESGSALNKDMEEFKKYFTGLTRDFGFCNVENGYIDENTGKLKLTQAIMAGLTEQLQTKIIKNI